MYPWVSLMIIEVSVHHYYLTIHDISLLYNFWKGFYLTTVYIALVVCWANIGAYVV